MANPQLIFETLSEKTSNFEEIVGQFNKLDKAGQAEFLEQTAAQLGLSDAAPTVSAKAQFEAGDPRAKLIKDPLPSGEFDISEDQPLPEPDQEFAPEGMVRGVVENISEAGALAGGIAGATTAGAASLGVGAPAGGIIGASVVGGAAQVVEDTILDFMNNEVEDINVLDQAISGAKGAAKGAVQEVGGILAGKVIGTSLKAAGRHLDDFGQFLSKSSALSTINEKIKRKLGKEGLEQIGKTLQDEGITNTPATLNKLGKRLDKTTKVFSDGLVKQYRKLQQSIGLKFQKETIADDVVESVMAYEESINRRLSTTAIKQMKREIKGVLKDANGLDDMWIAANSLQGNIFSSGTGANTVVKKASIGMRKTLEKYALKYGDEASELMQETQAMSAAARQLQTASAAVNAKLGRSESLKHMLQLASIGASMAAESSGTSRFGNEIALGIAVLSVVDGKTLAKTSGSAAGAALGKVGQTLIQKAPALGKIGNQFLRMAGRIGGQKGFEAVAKRHAHLMLNNAGYAKKINDLIEQESNQETSQEPIDTQTQE